MSEAGPRDLFDHTLRCPVNKTLTLADPQAPCTVSGH